MRTAVKELRQLEDHFWRRAEEAGTRMNFSGKGQVEIVAAAARERDVATIQWHAYRNAAALVQSVRARNAWGAAFALLVLVACAAAATLVVTR